MGKAKTKKLIWHLKIHYPDKDIVVHEQDYPSIKSMADDMKVSYNQMWEMTSRGRIGRRQIRYNFMPEVSITRNEHIS